MEIRERLSKEKIKGLSFEVAYERLTETAGQLERGNLSLEDSLALYEEGVLLSQHCEELLNRAELRVSQITTGPAARVEQAEAEDFSDEDDEDDFI